MALIFIDGFDAYGNTNNVTPVGMQLKWTDGSISSFSRVRDGRVGGKAVSLDAGNSCGISFAANQTLIAGFAFKAAFPIFGESRIIEFVEGSNVGINLRRQTNGEWSIYLGTSHIATTSGQALPVDTWATVELRVHVHNSTGAYELRVNGVNVLSGSGDTQPGSNAYHTGFRIVGTNVSGVQFYFDDLYLLEESGTENNTFIGSWKIQTIFPNGDGAVDCIPSTGSDNYAMTDDPATDGDSTYVTGDPADIDLYDYQSLTNVSDIYAIKVNTVCRQTDATPLSIKLLVKSGSTTDASASQVIGTTSYVARSEIWEKNPDTISPWTASDIASAQFGFEIE